MTEFTPQLRMSVALSVEATPFTGLNKTCPIKRMLPVFALQQGELSLAKRFAAPKALLQALVIRSHNFASGIVADRPEAHHHRFRARQNESPAQSVHAFTVPDLAHARVAGGKSNQLGPPQI